MRACFAAEVADGSGHWKGSPSAPRGARVVGMAYTERARVAARVARLGLKDMMRRGCDFFFWKEKSVLYDLTCARLLLAGKVEFEMVNEKVEALKFQTYGNVDVALMTRYV